jgi:hypothetical protein
VQRAEHNLQGRRAGGGHDPTTPQTAFGGRCGSACLVFPLMKKATPLWKLSRDESHAGQSRDRPPVGQHTKSPPRRALAHVICDFLMRHALSRSDSFNSVCMRPTCPCLLLQSFLQRCGFVDDESVDRLAWTLLKIHARFVLMC